jgi:hypothetical protein
MQFNPGAFNELLGNLGEYFNWRRASACPCLNPASLSPKANCPKCFGKGYLWGPGTRALAGVASSNVQQQWAKFGRWEQGDMVLSIPEDSPLYEIGMFDRVLCETSTDNFTLAMIRGAPSERMHGAVKEFTRVFWFDNNENIVEGGLPTVDVNGRLTWADGAPPGGKAYTIEGVKYQEYYCFGPFSNDRNKHAGMRLPRRMVLRKFDLLGRGSNA